jgi:hypothetical protein
MTKDKENSALILVFQEMQWFNRCQDGAGPSCCRKAMQSTEPPLFAFLNASCTSDSLQAVVCFVVINDVHLIRVIAVTVNERSRPVLHGPDVLALASDKGCVEST